MWYRQGGLADPEVLSTRMVSLCKYRIGLLVSKSKDCWTTNVSIPLFRRLCLFRLAPNFIQVMHDSTISTRLLVILGGISIGYIMAHLNFRKPRSTEANQRAPEASWQAQASSPRNDIHVSSDPHAAGNCSRMRYDCHFTSFASS